MDATTAAIIATVLVVLSGYFLPTIVAKSRKHHNTMPIFLLNLFLGWTGLGWLAALIWSTTRPPKAAS